MTRIDLSRPAGAAILACVLCLFLVALPSSSPAASQKQEAPETMSGVDDRAQRGFRGDPTGDAVFVPRVDSPPRIEDFEGMRPPAEVRRQYALVEGFTQRTPADGQPATQRTRVYLGYDDDSLHVVFVAHDEDPDGIRARMARREEIDADDRVWVILDPFRDRQRGYQFGANPVGVQRDGRFTEDRDSPDFSFDTLWYSEGTLTEDGYVVRMQIPFKSLRFPRQEVQTWGIVLARSIPRDSEESYWPPVSSRIDGILNQAGAITGLDRISPGRNIRLIPYGSFRSFEALDPRLPGGPDFVRDPADPDGGLDAKVVIEDAVVVDGTFNPDFSQVESDRPQNTVNRRFEVFFPEKRPFFLENADTFRTPINLLFTRRIADPRAGIRATGQLGDWSVGALAIDDLAPGRIAPEGSPLEGETARNGVLRVRRDLGGQSNLGLIYADRTLGDGHNRVGGIDGRIKLDANWVATFQAVATDTRLQDGTGMVGPGYRFEIARAGRAFDYRGRYIDLDEEFRADLGFVPRVGIRRMEHEFQYAFWPEGDVLQSWGPNLWYNVTWDQDGTRLDTVFNPWVGFNLPGQTNTGFFHIHRDTRLRPDEYPALGADRDFDADVFGFWLDTRLLSFLDVNVWTELGTRINFVPAAGEMPEVGDGVEGTISLGVRPTDRLRVGAIWLYSALGDRRSDDRVFRSDIYRGRLDYQLNRELSVRLITQYEVLSANPELTALTDRRNLNFDVLFTYLANPWTSVFVGYNRNARNLELLHTDDGNILRRTGGRLLNDADQLFVKVSYLISY